MILFWSFLVTFADILLHDKMWFVKKILPTSSHVYVTSIVLGYSAILQCFFPIAGYLADTRFGRYKTVLVSLWILLLVNAGIIAVVILQLFKEANPITKIVTGLVYFLFLVGLPGFQANIIQFGIDQVFYAANEEQKIFVHWYVWCYNLSGLLINLIFNIHIFKNNKVSHVLLSVLFSLITIVTLASFYFFYCSRKQWFLTESRYYNPYVMVYKVTKYFLRFKFSTRNRSASPHFESSTGLDLSNNQYKELFSVSQVEDVKAFYGIMKVLLSLGPVFFIHTAERHVLFLFPKHIRQSDFTSNESNHTSYVEQFLQSETPYYTIMLIILSIHIFLVRPYIQPIIQRNIFKMLTRMGLGILFSTLALLTLFTIDTMIHERNRDLSCIFRRELNNTFNDTQHVSHTLIIQLEYSLLLKHMLTAFSHAILYIAIYEFICSQSPQSMKGFLLGVLYAIRGVFEILASLLMVLLTFKYKAPFPSCGMIYYLLNVAAGGTALMIFTCVARGYKFRVRVQASTTYHHGRNYYSKLEDEESCESNIRNYGTF